MNTRTITFCWLGSAKHSDQRLGRLGWHRRWFYTEFGNHLDQPGWHRLIQWCSSRSTKWIGAYCQPEMVHTHLDAPIGSVVYESHLISHCISTDQFGMSLCFLYFYFFWSCNSSNSIPLSFRFSPSFHMSYLVLSVSQVCITLKLWTHLGKVSNFSLSLWNGQRKRPKL